MATISSPGVGSGLDIQTIVTQMLAMEKQPLAKLQQQAATTQSKLSAFGQLKSQVANLQDQAKQLASADTWAARSFGAANASVVTGTAADGATPTSFSLKVNHLARAQAVASASVPSGTNMAGTLTITLGAYDESDNFTAKSGTTPVQIPEIFSTDSLSQIATKINNADAGVKATVVTDANGQRLLIQSKDTGAENGFKLTTSTTDGASQIGQLTYDPINANPGEMTRTQQALNSQVEVNGLTLESSTNNYANVIDGVSFTALQASDTATDVTVANDTASMKQALTNLVESYNTLSKALKEMTKYDPNSKTAGTLQGDSTALGILSSVRRVLTGAGPSGGNLGTLSSLGLQFQADGTLKMDDSKVSAALEDPASVETLLVGNGTQSGIGKLLQDLTDGMLDTNGGITGRTTALNAALKRNSTDQEKVNDRVSTMEERLYAQYSRLDANLSQLKALNSYVAQQMSALTANNGG